MERDFNNQPTSAELKVALEQEVASRGREKARKRWLIVLIVAAVVFVASLVALGVIAFSYYQGQQKYDDIAQKADIDTADIDENAPMDELDLKVDWDALRAVNPDTVAWVYMPNTPINYPVLQGEDNEHYLNYDFDGEAGWLAEYGAIFLDYHNKKDFSDPVNFIYGHHMNDGSMFAFISTLEDPATFDQNRTIYLLTPKGNYRLRSFALVHCNDDDPIVETTFKNKAARTKYIQDKIDRSLAKPNDIPKAKDIDHVFAFATCDSFSAGRDIMFTYVVDTDTKDLSGDVGLDSNKNSTWFVDDIDAGK